MTEQQGAIQLQSQDRAVHTYREEESSDVSFEHNAFNSPVVIEENPQIEQAAVISWGRKKASHS